MQGLRCAAMGDVIAAPLAGLDLRQHYGHHQSPATRAGGLIFCSGMLPVDPETGAAKQVVIGKLALPGGIGVVSEGDKDTIYVADVFAYRTVDGSTGEVSEPARMHADGVTLEYPMSATAKGDDVILSSWFTGTVQVIDRKTGKTKEMMHGFKAPHDAVLLNDGSLGPSNPLSFDSVQFNLLFPNDPTFSVTSATMRFVTPSTAGFRIGPRVPETGNTAILFFLSLFLLLTLKQILQPRFHRGLVAHITNAAP